MDMSFALMIVTVRKNEFVARGFRLESDSVDYQTWSSDGRLGDSGGNGVDSMSGKKCIVIGCKAELTDQSELYCSICTDKGNKGVTGGLEQMAVKKQKITTLEWQFLDELWTCDHASDGHGICGWFNWRWYNKEWTRKIRGAISSLIQKGIVVQSDNRDAGSFGPLMYWYAVTDAYQRKATVEEQESLEIAKHTGYVYDNFILEKTDTMIGAE